jgi:Caspase domain
VLKSIIISPCSSQSSRLFALIIGINEYKTVKPPFLNLKGAVPDADLVQSYLQKHLGVPNSQIRNLRDSEATRAGILYEINALTTDDRIQRGDPILIFYAGHGSTAPTPKGWESEGPTIQLLLPHDFLCETVKGQKVYGIPDRSLCVLLGRLASVKGDNIVWLTVLAKKNSSFNSVPDSYL